MYYADYHTHSNCSPDGYVPMREMADAAVKSGLSELCLTDHCDLVGLNGERYDDYSWQEVLKQREEMRRLYGSRLELPLGLEFGSSHVDAEAARRILDQPELDFVIGSVHNHSLKNGGADFYLGKYSSPRVCYDALDDYFSSLEILAPLDTYDVLGHIIYPLRYMAVRDGQAISLDGYMERIRGILRAVAEHGRGIALNTWPGKPLGDWVPGLKLYRQCGGEIVTVGSDAHIPAGVGRGIPEAYELLLETGFPYVAAYRSRKPRMIKI
jgi:histidinol-phosphatase (PHP family)